MNDGESIPVRDFHPVTPGLSRKRFREGPASCTLSVTTTPIRLTNHRATVPIHSNSNRTLRVISRDLILSPSYTVLYLVPIAYFGESALSTLSCLDSPSRE